jgi:hypothetical protein
MASLAPPAAPEQKRAASPAPGPEVQMAQAPAAAPAHQQPAVDLENTHEISIEAGDRTLSIHLKESAQRAYFEALVAAEKKKAAAFFHNVAENAKTAKKNDSAKDVQAESMLKTTKAGEWVTDTHDQTTGQLFFSIMAYLILATGVLMFGLGLGISGLSVNLPAFLVFASFFLVVGLSKALYDLSNVEWINDHLYGFTSNHSKTMRIMGAIFIATTLFILPIWLSSASASAVALSVATTAMLSTFFSIIGLAIVLYFFRSVIFAGDSKLDEKAQASATENQVNVTKEANTALNKNLAEMIKAQEGLVAQEIVGKVDGKKNPELKSYLRGIKRNGGDEEFTKLVHLMAFQRFLQEGGAGLNDKPMPVLTKLTYPEQGGQGEGEMQQMAVTISAAGCHVGNARAAARRAPAARSPSAQQQQRAAVSPATVPTGGHHSAAPSGALPQAAAPVVQPQPSAPPAQAAAKPEDGTTVGGEKPLFVKRGRDVGDGSPQAAVSSSSFSVAANAFGGSQPPAAPAAQPAAAPRPEQRAVVEDVPNDDCPLATPEVGETLHLLSTDPSSSPHTP